MSIRVNEVHKFGRNASVGTTAEPIVDENAQGNAFPTAAAATTILSTSVEDDTDKGAETPGTGAFTVSVFGVNTSGAYIEETATMNGTAAVALNNQFKYVLRAKVLTAGTGLTNAGRIDVKHGATVIACIAVAAGQTEIAAWHFVKAGKVVQLDIGVEAISTKTVTANLIVRTAAGVTREVFHTIISSELPYLTMPFEVPMRFEAGDLIYVVATGSTGTTAVYARLHIKE